MDYTYINHIDSPADLKKLRVDELPAVCAELRQFIIEALSKNPGHLASSLGTIELTVALHYVFDTPNDKLVWDVGHQAYAHKILTGRRDRFHTNRQFKGLSPFTNPAESEYDAFIILGIPRFHLEGDGLGVAHISLGDGHFTKGIFLIGQVLDDGHAVHRAEQQRPDQNGQALEGDLHADEVQRQHAEHRAHCSKHCVYCQPFCVHFLHKKLLS